MLTFLLMIVNLFIILVIVKVIDIDEVPESDDDILLEIRG